MVDVPTDLGTRTEGPQPNRSNNCAKYMRYKFSYCRNLTNIEANSIWDFI